MRIRLRPVSAVLRNGQQRHPFGRAYESKVSRVEEEDAPAASVSFSVISMNSPFLNAWFLKV